ncbi:hypothetical protein [Brucella rhizosphaerae]|uniref:hypothetical protein n=1 Tax=Brucella rhizosphaerae TaxID=571254 RepID=UPI0036090EAE
MIAKALKCTLSAVALCAFTTAALAQSSETIVAGAKKEGQLVSYGMSDDWVNLGAIFGKIEEIYGVEHVDTDMTSGEQITHLLAEKNAPVMDIGDIGYDFLAPSRRQAGW